jgi:hypothetical protein
MAWFVELVTYPQQKLQIKKKIVSSWVSQGVSTLWWTQMYSKQGVSKLHKMHNFSPT